VRVPGFEEALHDRFNVPVMGAAMPADVAGLRDRRLGYFLGEEGPSKKATSAASARLAAKRINGERKVRIELAKDWQRLRGKLLSEIHSRASFAISCLVLVLVGCALGMMFRSSNFLSAFAVSFVPAMFSIALIVTGQQVCSHAHNSMGLGLAFIWGGNGIVLMLSIGLLWWLHRT
jgi:lipopolysaccharide export LptBFGC system permease protein LptF